MGLNKIGRNSIWMMLEKIISIFGLFFVTSYVAKYIGPSLFGELSLAMAIFQIVQIVSQMGGDNIIFKRVSKNPDSGVRLIRSSFLMRLAVYVAISVAVLGYFYTVDDTTSFIFCIAVCIASFFTTLDVYAIYNNSQLRSKYNTISNVIGLGIGLGIRYLIALMQWDPALLAIPIVLTTAIPFFIRRHDFITRSASVTMMGRNWKSAAKKYSKYMIMSGSSIVLSSISVAIYTRINQIFISDFLGSYQLGIYSVALTLATAWTFALASIITSFYPSIYADTNDRTAMAKAVKLNRIVFLCSALVIAGFALFGRQAIALLYGAQYAAAYLPALILSVGTMLSLMGSIAYRYVIKYSGFSYLSKKMFLILAFSLPVSYLLIKQHGLIGASVSVVLVELLSLTVMNYFFKNGLIVKLHIGSIGFAWGAK